MRLLLFSLLSLLSVPAAAQVTPIFRAPAAPTWGVPSRAAPPAGAFRVVVPEFRPAGSPGAGVRVPPPTPSMAGPPPPPSYVGASGAPVPTIGIQGGQVVPRCLPDAARSWPPSVLVPPAPPPGAPPPIAFAPPVQSWGAPPPGPALNLSRALRREVLRPHAIATVALEGVGITVGPRIPAGPPAPTPVGVFPPAVGGPPPGAPTPNYVPGPPGAPPSITVALPLAPAGLGPLPPAARAVPPNSQDLRVIRRQRGHVAGVEFDMASSVAAAAERGSIPPAANTNSVRTWSTCPGGGGCEHLQSRAYRAGPVAGAATVCTAGQACRGRGGVAIDYWQGRRVGQLDALPSGQITANVSPLRPGAQVGADAIVDFAAANQTVVPPERILGAYNEARSEVIRGAPVGNGLVLPSWTTQGPIIGPVR